MNALPGSAWAGSQSECGRCDTACVPAVGRAHRAGTARRIARGTAMHIHRSSPMAAVLLSGALAMGVSAALTGTASAAPRPDSTVALMAGPDTRSAEQVASDQAAAT